MYELTGSTDTALFERARLAADFLLRIQREDGDFPGSVLKVPSTGTAAVVVRPANFAATSSAILLWSKIYALTKNQTYLTAATRCADAVAMNYLKEGELQIDGGELDDVMVNRHTVLILYSLYCTILYSYCTH
jgi:hypothetical protein